MEQVVNDHGEVGKPWKDGQASEEGHLTLGREYNKSIYFKWAKKVELQ